MLPFQMMAGGFFVQGADPVAVDIELQSQCPPDYIRVLNRSAFGDVAEGTQAVQYEWFKDMAQGTALSTVQTTATGALSALAVAADGISNYNTANPPTFAPLALTAITAANPPVISMAETGTIAAGDTVRLINTTGMLQVAGYEFTVLSVINDTSITLDCVDFSGFAAPATAGSVIKIIPNRFYPRWDFIAAIAVSAIGSQALITFTRHHDFTEGEIIGLRVSSAFGMKEVNNKEVRVLSVPDDCSVIVDLDVSGFTAFAFPSSAVAAAGVSPAVAVPSASGVVPFNGSATVPQQPPGTNLRDSFDNRNVCLIHLGASLFADGAEGDVWEWMAFKFDLYKTS
jgi:hypothetical protein